MKGPHLERTACMITVPPASGKYENRGSRPPTEKLTYRQIPCGSSYHISFNNNSKSYRLWPHAKDTSFLWSIFISYVGQCILNLFSLQKLYPKISHCMVSVNENIIALASPASAWLLWLLLANTYLLILFNNVLYRCMANICSLL